MLSLDEARALLASRAAPLPPARVALDDALGLHLAEPSRSALTLPPFDASAMDGYAVRHADLGSAALPVSSEVPAGATPAPLSRGSAARIFTGAPLPAGADTVIPQEQAQVGADGRVLLRPLARGANVRPAGDVLVAGAPLLGPGSLLSPAPLATLIAAGLEQVLVHPRPRLAVVVTGAELAEPGARPAAGQIRDSNRPLLAALGQQDQLEVVSQMRVGDDLEALKACFSRALAKADLVVSSGGVSVGDYDLVPAALRALGAEIVLHHVRIKPGKPILVAALDGRWIVGLPGNPVSALCCYRLFVQPLARCLAGAPGVWHEPPLHAVLRTECANDGKRLLFWPARLSVTPPGQLAVEALPWRGSHDIAAAMHADALVELQPGARIAAGQLAPVIPMRQGLASSRASE